jgi:hypothetical protein
MAPVSTAELVGSLVRWPTRRELTRARATAQLRLPDGTSFETDALVRLESEELYSRDLDLGEL